ncbi:type II CAAX prenyl endopeptidase Rce1 family protein [Rhodovulum sp. ES.010]|uniref:CPBP family glutamic-type intramembrane protease n=1 Tax=Rhodovulum sp. ES.010 TaxID=1882821 RepID=UPI000941469C|nr:CPBP family glutamic-type intramembrane protease [Rhodovulum sp. ES.010]
MGWYLARGLGTVLLVPLVEELFFRDYLEGKLRLGQGRAWAVAAALVSASAFAALHDRWAEALVAGLVFSWVCRRRGRIGDAVLAHAVANAVVYGVAVTTGNLQII